MEESEFQRELEKLINRTSQENASDTPDWVLATYLGQCLDAFNRATNLRESYYGRSRETVAPEDAPQEPSHVVTTVNVYDDSERYRHSALPHDEY